MSARDPRRRSRVRPEHRPPRITKWQLSVLRACPKFTGEMYKYMTLVWDLSTDDLDGDFKSQREAARELGLNADYVGDIRQHLALVGVLIVARPEGSTLTYHYLTLPGGIEAAPPSGARTEERRAWIAQQVARLVAHVGRREADPAVRRSSPILRAQDRARARGTSLRLGGTPPTEVADLGETTLAERGTSPRTEHEEAPPPGSSVYTQESDNKSVHTPRQSPNGDKGARAPQRADTEQRAPRGAARAAGQEPRCDDCGEPLEQTPHGRLLLCSCASSGRRASEART
jgi:hypothetical protein